MNLELDPLSLQYPGSAPLRAGMIFVKRQRQLMRAKQLRQTRFGRNWRRCEGEHDPKTFCPISRAQLGGFWIFAAHRDERDALWPAIRRICRQLPMHIAEGRRRCTAVR